MLFPMTIVMMFLKGGNTRFLTTTAHSLGVSHLVRVQPYQRKLISHQEDNLPTHSSLVSTGCLKVSKNRNDFMNTSFFPKSINLMYGQYSRAVSNQEQVIVVRVRYILFELPYTKGWNILQSLHFVNLLGCRNSNSTSKIV